MGLNHIALAMLIVGVGLLLFSLRPVNLICRKDDSWGWRILHLLVVFFIIGYLGLFYYLSKQTSISTSDFIVALIMFAGGLFVFLVIRFSLSSLIKLEQATVLERNNALQDSLTGLPNRKFLMESLQRHIDQECHFSLIMIDLNRFKQINDALGHYYGDLLLALIGQKVNAALSDSTQLFRLGGDEFAIIASNVDKANIKNTIDIVHACLDVPFEVENYVLSINASVGVTHFPTNGCDIGILLQQSDIAMYDSKKKSTLFTIYNDALKGNAAEKIDIAARLKVAIELQQFELWYQPIINIQTNTLHGAEALIRWPQADGSFIGPDKFIKIAEQSTLITQITDWVMQKVLDDMQSFAASKQQLNIHLNLSVRDLQDEHLVSKVTTILNQYLPQVPQLSLEITESAMMTNIEQVKNNMELIANLGLAFSIDDFGSGFSSLALLRDLPVGQIKIDRSFISNMSRNQADLAIVKSTIFLAHTLNCSVVAEGVEDKETESLLKELGCDYVQGYYYSKAQHINDFVQYLQTYNTTNVLHQAL